MKESKYLQDNIQNIQKLFVIPSLKNFETKSLSRLIKLSKVRQYEDGEVIIKEGDTDPWLYFLLSGEVRIVKDNHDIAKMNRQGEMFGEMRFLDNMSRSTSVIASGPTVCLAINTTGATRLPSAGEAANFLLMLYQVTSEYVSTRLRLTNDELIKTKNQVELLKHKLSSS
jgi:CRP/FNR family transcriptional regulator, cyclic AMP receptor protein